MLDRISRVLDIRVRDIVYAFMKDISRLYIDVKVAYVPNIVVKRTETYAYLDGLG